MEDDWDLFAVVRSCCRSSSSNSTSTTTSISTTTTPPPTTSSAPIVKMDDSFSCFSFLEKENSFFSSSDLFQPQSPLNELEQLYKPFVPNYQQQQQISISPFNPNSNPNPNPNPISPLSNLSSSTILPPRLQMKQEIQLPRRSISSSTIAPRPKRRKNQQKKVVCQVPAEGLSSDMWAWRKYGQKPIKGSPYPRGYYRCSSSKGCLARKQVERSRTDPGMFIVTYTAEHNHPVPTHRNSLAGSTRHKLSTPSTGTNTNISKPSTSTSPLGLSPTTPLTSSMEEDEEEQSKDGEDGFSKLEEGLMSDDLFLELERQGEGEGEATSSGTAPGFFDDCFTPSSLWFNTTSATAAGSV